MKRYRNIITNMPVREHAFTTKKSTWMTRIESGTETSNLLDEIFGLETKIEVSRGDLFKLATHKQYKKLILATILWGYPGGMRGNHFRNISDNLDSLEKILTDAVKGIKNWDEHYQKTKKIVGLGISTYSKLLYFCGAKVNSVPCVILDDRIIETIQKDFIPELSPLTHIKPHNSSKNYATYLKTIDSASKKLGASHDQIEMFLFQFGKNLKP